MKQPIFISWSGDEGKAMAEALREWLPDVLQVVEPWTSCADITAGSRWGTEIAAQLESCRFGVICLTARSTHRPWILFEAGALGKTLANTSVCPYLLDLEFSELPGPLAQFQSVKADESGTRQLVRAINDSLGVARIDTERLERSFSIWWPHLGNRLDDLRSSEKKRTSLEIELLKDPLSRTTRLVADLTELAKLDDIQLSQATVRYSGLFSAFAIDDDESQSPPEYQKALLQERDTLLSLAQRGCRVRCVISPPAHHQIPQKRVDYVRRRTKRLVNFLDSNNSAHPFIEWAVSPFRQKNLYIVGTDSCFEGLKKQEESGYFLTLRQTRPEAVATNIAFYDVLFEYLETYTLHADKPKEPEFDHRQALRHAARRRVEQSFRDASQDDRHVSRRVR